MIRYLAYYSFGGYKDMMLGTNESIHDVTYYSPFLQPWLSGTMENLDGRMIQQLTQLKDLGQIEIIGPGCDYRMPNTAKTLSSHGGYQLVCCRLEDGTYSVAVRNLVNDTKDEFGRPIPFMMQIVLDDAGKADQLTAYIRSNQKEAKTRLGELFAYDPNLNCLRFELKKANCFVEKAIANGDAELNTLCSVRVRSIVVSDTMNLDYALKEIGFTRRDVCEAYNESGRQIYIEEFSDADTNLSNRYDDHENESLHYLLAKISSFKLLHEDKDDIQAIKEHLRNILYRHSNK